MSGVEEKQLGTVRGCCVRRCEPERHPLSRFERRVSLCECGESVTESVQFQASDCKQALRLTRSLCEALGRAMEKTSTSPQTELAVLARQRWFGSAADSVALVQ